MNISVVCFDIGGVLAHVNLNWHDAMVSASVEPTVPPGGRLEDCPAFSQFQNGELDLEEYLDGLAQFLKIAPEMALPVHDGILDRPTEGTQDIVDGLNRTKILTACLSNTNAPHWDVLTDPQKFPNIASLKLKTASHLYGLSKPNPEVYRKFEQDAKARPEQILFFEDNLDNFNGAIECGWNAVLVDPKARQDRQIAEALRRFQVEFEG